MWKSAAYLRLVWTALQHCCSWTQHVCHDNKIGHLTDSDSHSSILFQNSQALLKFDGMVSQYPATPAENGANYARDDYRDMKDDEENEQKQFFIEIQHEQGPGPRLPHDKHGSHHRHVHRNFVHGEHGNDSLPHNGENPPNAVATAIALMLVGMMAAGICIFYLVNYPDEDIQALTWSILSSTISIFCAVLIFSALRCMVEMLLGEKVGVHSHHPKPDSTVMISSFVHFIIMFILTQALIVLHREKNTVMKAWAKLGGHVTAFAAIEAFGTLMHHSFSSTWHYGLLLVGLAFLILCGLSTLAQYMRVFLEPKSSDLQRKLFHEEGNATDHEYVSLTMGLLVSLLVRQMITGHLPPIHGSPRNKTISQIWQLFGGATTFIIALVIFGTYVARDTHTEKSIHKPQNHWVHLWQSTLSLSAGWCFLSWGQWLFWSTVGENMGEADKMSARMIMAIAFSALVFSCIFIFDFVAEHIVTNIHRTPRALMSTMALLLGLAWEAVFTLAIESISGNYKSPGEYIYCELGLTFCLCGLVLPAWVMYIIPRVEEMGDVLEG
eukprot:gnl/MRDRNA2_/MRDRNA2_93265_c0_seq1.p1 gnl/MRDRNA2_/MRDRNA2_93265_c0~~gnl/MRDRNA2_/MRDRNA2_93265_c0_seq1.p1  ORF type:complete len:552 (+),score=66.43 gnl/MRDRNA2_/MRDRNA2_93265_c0_seq1:90-1745(+)